MKKIDRDIKLDFFDYKNKNKFYTNKEDFNKDYELDQKIYRKKTNINKYNQHIKTRKIIMILSSICIIVLSLIITLRIIYGPLYIDLTNFDIRTPLGVLEYPEPFVPTYEVLVNGNSISYKIEQKKEKTIIPFFVKSVNYANDRNAVAFNIIENEEEQYVNYNNEFNLSINGKYCYSRRKFSIYTYNCINEIKKYEEVDYKIDNIEIKYDNNIYNINSFDNLIEYMYRDGIYDITIKLVSKNLESIIYFKARKESSEDEIFN